MRDKYLIALALCVGLMLGFLWCAQPEMQQPPVPAVTTQHLRAVPQIPPKERSVKVTLEKIQASTSKPKKKKKKATVISKIYRVDRSLVRSGMALVGEKGEHLGSFPAITANYRKKVGFSTYVISLQSLGAKFLIHDRTEKKLVCEVDFLRRSLDPVNRLDGLSPRSRIISNESRVHYYIELAEVLFGKGDYQMILLLPLRLDAALIAGMERALRRHGYDVRDFISLQARYEKGFQSLSLVVVKGIHKTGRRVSLNIRFNLDYLSRRRGHET